MFTGIIEELGEVKSLKREQSNLHIWMRSNFLEELKVDQSIAHNGVCLTVSRIVEDAYEVIVVEESLSKTNLASLKAGDEVNLERCMKLNQRLDGHMVQGHVDTIAEVTDIEERNGSTNFHFCLAQTQNLIVEKGSISINGVSLTSFNVEEKTFSVSIIPYTLEHTNFKFLKKGSTVNVEFDIIGKYVSRLLSKDLSSN